ncbi:MAG: hypothetical protein WHU93_08615, partial [Arcobacteraceae bacterium]
AWTRLLKFSINFCCSGCKAIYSSMLQKLLPKLKVNDNIKIIKILLFINGFYTNRVYNKLKI